MLLKFGFVNVAKSWAGRQQLSQSLAWHRLFSQQ
jgi:hypothetical protein